MCLGIPGEVIELMPGHEDLAMVSVEGVKRAVNIGLHLFGVTNPETGLKEWDPNAVAWAKAVSLVMFGVLAAFLVYVGSRRENPAEPGRPAA